METATIRPRRSRTAGTPRREPAPAAQQAAPAPAAPAPAPAPALTGVSRVCAYCGQRTDLGLLDRRADSFACADQVTCDQRALSSGLYPMLEGAELPAPAGASLPGPPPPQMRPGERERELAAAYERAGRFVGLEQRAVSAVREAMKTAR